MKDNYLTSSHMDEKKNSNMFHLWWVNKKTQKKFCAGRAFYSDKNGDFTLFINLLESSSADGRKDELYLRPVEVTEDQIYYRLEKVVHRNNKSMRFWIGEAFQSKRTDGDIHIHIEPLTGYTKKLVLCITKPKEIHVNQ
jgi:hypothetical protein